MKLFFPEGLALSFNLVYHSKPDVHYKHFFCLLKGAVDPTIV